MDVNKSVCTCRVCVEKLLEKHERKKSNKNKIKMQHKKAVND
jgi:hypothetical protein